MTTHRVQLGGVMCPACHIHMDLTTDTGRWYCTACPRYALTDTDSREDIEAREAARQNALALLDAALGVRAVQRDADRQITQEMETTMGQTIQTRGCPKCGSTMYRTVDVDDNGNPISVPTFICNNCGHMEG